MKFLNQLVGALYYIPKGCGLNPQSGSAWEAANRCFPPPLLPTKTINKFKKLITNEMLRPQYIQGSIKMESFWPHYVHSGSFQRAEGRRGHRGHPGVTQNSGGLGAGVTIQFLSAAPRSRRSGPVQGTPVAVRAKGRARRRFSFPSLPPSL